MTLLTGNKPVFTKDPFAEIDRIFEDMLKSPDSLSNRLRRGINEIGMTKSADIDNHRIIKIVLPGVTPEEVELGVQGNYLTWRVEKGNEEGSFISRTQGNHHLGSELDTDKIEADLTNGILTISIAHREKPEPQRINVGTGGSLSLGSANPDKNTESPDPDESEEDELSDSNVQEDSLPETDIRDKDYEISESWLDTDGGPPKRYEGDGRGS